MPSGVNKLGTICMPLQGLIDVATEKKRLSAQLDKVADDLQRTAGKLGNMDFVSKAPKDVVDRQKARKQELLEKSEKLKRLIDILSHI